MEIIENDKMVSRIIINSILAKSRSECMMSRFWFWWYGELFVKVIIYEIYALFLKQNSMAIDCSWFCYTNRFVHVLFHWFTYFGFSWNNMTYKTVEVNGNQLSHFGFNWRQCVDLIRNLLMIDHGVFKSSLPWSQCRYHNQKSSSYQKN